MCRAAAERLSPAAEASPAPPDLLRVLSRLLATRCIPLSWYRHSERPLARELAQRSLALLERPELAGRDVRHERAFVLMNYAVFSDHPSYAEAAGLFERVVALYGALGERWWTAYALDRWGRTARKYNEVEEAERLHERSAHLFRELGNLLGLTSAYYYLTAVWTHLGRFEEAERLARENLALRYSLAEDGTHGGHAQVALSLALLGRYAEALPFIEECFAIFRRMGRRVEGMQATMVWIWIEASLGRYEEARRRCQALLEESRQLGQPSYSSLALTLLGWIDLASSAYHEAWRHGQEALALRGTWWPFSLSPSPLLGYAARGMGRPDSAQPFASQALREALDAKSVPMLLEALPVAALALIDRGEVARGVETYALASRYPYVTNSRWFEDIAGQQIAAVAETLPPEAVATAQERGCARDLWATADELLAELSGDATHDPECPAGYIGL
jgi:tetratricopeptide (TPR) repeat protein